MVPRNPLHFLCSVNFIIFIKLIIKSSFNFWKLKYSIFVLKTVRLRTIQKSGESNIIFSILPLFINLTVVNI